MEQRQEAEQDRTAVFDPYVKWLGIRSPQRPPNHYDLLGISLFESDPDVIAAAAERQMAHLRRYQNGPHSAVSQKILNQLAAAKLCLQRADQKRAYDSELRAISHPGKKSRVIALALSVLLVSLISWGIAQMVPSPHKDGELVGLATPPRDDAAPDEDTGGQVRVVDAKPGVTSSEPNNPSDSTEPDIPPWDLPLLADQIKRPKDAVRAALFDRNVGAARTAVGKARSAARSPTDREQVNLMDAYVYCAERYWQSVDRALADPALTGSQLRFRERLVDVVGLNNQTIELRASGGQTKRFDLDRKQMSIHVASALARRQLGETSGKTDLIAGVVMLHDRQGDKGLAKALLSRAQSQGQPIEILFPPEQVYGGGASVAEAQPAEPNDLKQPDEGPAIASSREETHVPNTPETLVSTNMTAESPQESPPLGSPPLESPSPDEAETESDRRQSVPSAEAVTTSVAAIQQLYKDEYQQRGQAAKAALAAKLLNEGNQTRDDGVAKYALYQEAIRVGVEGQSPRLASNAIDAMAHNFSIDEFALRHDMVAESASRVTAPGAQLSLLNECKRATDHFLLTDDFKSAGAFVELTYRIGRRTKEPLLKTYARDLRADFLAKQRLHETMRTAFQTLADSPTDPGANQRVGEYRFVQRQQFESGLQHLARGTDEPLSRLAKQQLSGALAPARVAEAWWAESLKLKGIQASSMRRHAALIYAAAFSKLTGITRETAEQRLLEHLEPLGGSPITLSALQGPRWTIHWLDEDAWSSVHFKQENRDIVIRGNGPVWHATAHEINGDVRFLTRDGKSIVILNAHRNNLIAHRIRLANGALEAIGTVQSSTNRS